MEQQPSLMFGQRSRPESPDSVPATAVADNAASSTAAPASEHDGTASASSSTSTLKPEEDNDAVKEEYKSEGTTEAVLARAQQHGLYQGSLEEEVGQVVNQLSSWGGSFWGLAKKQVRLSVLKHVQISDGY